MGEISVNVSEDDAQWIEEYSKDNDLSQSEAIRRLLQAGLRHTEEQDMDADIRRLHSRVSDLNDRLDELDSRVKAIEDRFMWLG